MFSFTYNAARAISEEERIESLDGGGIHADVDEKFRLRLAIDHVSSVVCERNVQGDHVGLGVEFILRGHRD